MYSYLTNLNVQLRYNKMDYTKFINKVSRSRNADIVKILAGRATDPSTLRFAGGLPNPVLFPFKEAEFKMRDGTVLHLDEDRMKFALQYQLPEGLGELRSFLNQMQKTFHNPPNIDKSPEQGGMDICVTVGSSDGISKSFDMLVTPSDTVLIESPVYAGALIMLKPLGCKLLPIEVDHHGLVPSSLLATLRHCRKMCDSSENQSMPKFLYTVPNASNPTGSSTTIERKRDIYQIAREFDFLILEDDAYFFLQFNLPRIPSYLSMDTDGRVLRFDSFSKIISPGLRLGFVTGPKPLIERIILHLQASVAYMPTFSQVMLSDLLQSWGIDGLKQQISKVTDFYRNQRDLMIAAANKWLTGLAEWKEPQGGMFLWLKLKGIPDTKRLMDEKAQKKGVSFVPGCAYMIDHTFPCPYIRASFSSASAEEIDKGFQRLGEMIKEELSQGSADQHRDSNTESPELIDIF